MHTRSLQSQTNDQFPASSSEQMANSGTALTNLTSKSTQLSASNQRPLWPARWGHATVDQGQQTGVIIELGHPSDELVPARLSRFHQLRTGDAEYRDTAALATALGIDHEYRFKPEGPGSYLFVHEPVDKALNGQLDDQLDNQIGAQKVLDSQDDVELAFKFISGTIAGRTTVSSEQPQEMVEIERTWFTYRTPKAKADQVGTLVLMPGMFGTPEPIIDATERYMRSKGWGVLRMLAHPARFTQRLQVGVPPGFEQTMASKIATISDTRVAECAYAVSSALRFVESRYPEAAELPTALMGMSGGAMVLPAVYSFDPNQYDAAVLVAGGGNFLEINTRSEYKSWIDAMELDADPSDHEVQKPSQGQLELLWDLYLQESKLDALHTAKNMVDMPVLMLHASADKAVPASTGDALHKALGEPDRWTFPVGHELIFVALPMQMSKIESWMRERIVD
ncbi:MAG: alpha/beta hydrolase family protein [Phycisphaerales bacterium]